MEEPLSQRAPKEAKHDDMIAQSKKKQESSSSSSSKAHSGGAPSPSPPPVASKATSSPTTAAAGDEDLERLWRQREGSWLHAAASHSRDAWVWSRGDRASLLALSGAVPFNGEPPLSDLFEAGLVTPTKLHHVRNHGPTPKIDSETYQLQIAVEAKQPQAADEKKASSESGRRGEAAAKHEKEKGDADTPAESDSSKSQSVLRSLNMSDLRALPSTRLLVTLTCDGVRRKELNQLEHSKGINTGPAATGTSHWTGVLLVDLLRHCGVDMEQVQQQYPFVVFEGLDAACAKGNYGTSLPSSHALDPRAQVLLAWAQNDESLTPDHGAPLRVIVPGYVGGRSVKWLGRILLSSQPSSSAYHREDNMLLPSSVTLSQWNSGRYFGAQELVMYEQLVNSTIVKPSHEEWLQVAAAGGGSGDSKVRVEGFASAGGGRRVMRVEVSPDGGHSWLLATLRYADIEQQQKEDGEKKQAGGKPAGEQKAGEKKADSQSPLLREAFAQRPRCWSWCFWSVDIPAFQLQTSSSPFATLCVRACDETFQTQPRDLRWNVTGMMNNAWYTLRVETRRPQGAAGPVFLRFEHSVLPGSDGGGWMKPSPAALAPAARLDQSAAMARSGPLLGLAAHRAHKLIAMDEVEKHRSEDDCWIVMDGIVYDVSSYLRDHPGGSAALLSATRIPSADLSALFRSIHGGDAYEITGRFAIGYVAPREVIQALDDFYGGAHERHTRDEQGKLVNQQKKFYIGDGKLHHEADGEGKAGAGKSKGCAARLDLGGSKQTLQHLHRRPHWQERPDPALKHPETGERLIPSPDEHPQQTFLLHCTRWSPVRLLQVREMSHDTKLFTFGAAEGAFDAVGLTTGQHLLLSATIGDEQVVRPYTPTWPVSFDDEDTQDDQDTGYQRSDEQEQRSSEEEGKEAARHEDRKTAHALTKGRSRKQRQREDEADAAVSGADKRHPQAHFELLIKIYRRHGGMPGGKLTQYLDTLTPDSKTALRVLGPTGHVLYLGGGYFNIHGVGVRVQRINLIGGGTGITPLWQLLRAILCAPASDKDAAGVQLSLVYANKTTEDILMREEIDKLAAAYPHRLRVVHVLSQAEAHQDHPQQHEAAAKQGSVGAAEKAPTKAPAKDGADPAAAASSDSAATPSRVRVEHGHVSAYLFRRHLFPPAPSQTRSFVCGPPGMVDATLQHLMALAFDDACIIEF